MLIPNFVSFKEHSSQFNCFKEIISYFQIIILNSIYNQISQILTIGIVRPNSIYCNINLANSVFDRLINSSLIFTIVFIFNHSIPTLIIDSIEIDNFEIEHHVHAGLLSHDFSRHHPMVN